MIHRPIANRRREVDLYVRMLKESGEKRILLIEAESGFGKSELLAQFAEHCPPERRFVLVDLKAAQTGMLYVFWKISDELGIEHFGNFARALETFGAAPTINVSGNRSFGVTHIHAALNVDEKIRQDRLVSLHQAFFDDLRAFPLPLVIVFDTFNDAIAEVQNWLGIPFLSAVRRLPRTIVIVAGQQVPPHSAEWMTYAESIQLMGIHDSDDWQSFASERGWLLTPEVIRAFIHYLNGHPKKIIDAFESLARRGGGV